jgi:hypothetical protein
MFMPIENSLSVEDKEKLFKNLIDFVESDFDQSKFTKFLYTNLSSMYGHIAHYDLMGFYQVWFSDDDSRLRWLEFVYDTKVYGSPAYTRSDVEIAFQDWLKGNTDIIKTYIDKVHTSKSKEHLDMLGSLIQAYPEEAAQILKDTNAYSKTSTAS